MKEDKKKMIKKGISFLIILFVLLLIINLLYVTFIQSNKIIIKKELEWQEYKSNISDNVLDYAFFGDSHAKSGLNYRFVNNSYNFAIAGEDYVETYYKINKILEQDQININTFVLEIDTHTFSDNLRTNARLFRELAYYTEFMDLREVSNLKENNILSVWIKSKLIFVGQGRSIVSYLFKLSRNKKESKVNPKMFSEAKNKTQIAQSRYKDQFSQEKNLLTNRSVKYFFKILDIAKRNNISIIFIKYPVSFEYNQELENNNISRKTYYNDLFSQIEMMNLSYEVLDYYDLFFQNNQYFGDSDHLNTKGSEFFSKQVANDLKKISSKNKDNLDFEHKSIGGHFSTFACFPIK